MGSSEAVPTVNNAPNRHVVRGLIAPDSAVQGQKGVRPLKVILHFDPEFFVVRMESSRRESIANFAGDASFGETFAH